MYLQLNPTAVPKDLPTVLEAWLALVNMLRPTALISLQLLTWFSFQCLADGGLITRPQSAQVPSTEVLEQEMEYLVCRKLALFQSNYHHIMLFQNSSAPFLKSFERTVHKLPPAEQQVGWQRNDRRNT